MASTLEGKSWRFFFGRLCWPTKAAAARYLQKDEEMKLNQRFHGKQKKAAEDAAGQVRWPSLVVHKLLLGPVASILLR